MTTRTQQIRWSKVAAIALASTVIVLGGCRGDRSGKPPRQFFPDLDDQPKMKTQTKNTVWQEFEGKKTEPSWGRTARMPVTHTVPFGRAPLTSPVTGYRIQDGETIFRTVDFAERDRFLALDPRIHRGADLNGVDVPRIPIPVTIDLIEIGREKYEIYCLACHGGTGKGDGVVGTRWAYPLPNFQDDVWQLGAADDNGQPLATATDGHIFNIIREGKVNPTSPTGYAMPPYGGKLSVEESWAVVAYIRTLQATQRGSIDTLRRYNRTAADALLQNISVPPSDSMNGGAQ